MWGTYKDLVRAAAAVIWRAVVPVELHASDRWLIATELGCALAITLQWLDHTRSTRFSLLWSVLFAPFTELVLLLVAVPITALLTLATQPRHTWRRLAANLVTPLRFVVSIWSIIFIAPAASQLILLPVRLMAGSVLGSLVSLVFLTLVYGPLLLVYLAAVMWTMWLATTTHLGASSVDSVYAWRLALVAAVLTLGWTIVLVLRGASVDHVDVPHPALVLLGVGFASLQVGVGRYYFAKQSGLN